MNEYSGAGRQRGLVFGLFVLVGMLCAPSAEACLPTVTGHVSVAGGVVIVSKRIYEDTKAFARPNERALAVLATRLGALARPGWKVNAEVSAYYTSLSHCKADDTECAFFTLGADAEGTDKEPIHSSEAARYTWLFRQAATKLGVSRAARRRAKARPVRLYDVQLGTFSSHKAARAFAAKAESAALKFRYDAAGISYVHGGSGDTEMALVSPSANQGRALYRVRMRFTNAASARAIRKQFRRAGYATALTVDRIR